MARAACSSSPSSSTLIKYSRYAISTSRKAVGHGADIYGLLLIFGTHQDRACDQGDAGSSANVLASAARLWNFLR